MNADRIQLNVVPVQEQVKQSRQAFKLVDNRPLAIAQAKLIDLLSSGIPIQRSATFVSVPNQAVRELKPFVDTDHSRVIVSADPGFGQNYGKLDADIYYSHGEAHSEPNLISQKYAGMRGDWDVADRAVHNANGASGGRTPFTLYTERKPCSVKTNCLGHLQAPLYKTTDRVEYTYSAGTTPLEIAAQYFIKAQNVLPPGPDVTFGPPIAQDVFDARYGTSTPKIVIPYIASK